MQSGIKGLTVYEVLLKDAGYALRSLSRDLVYRAIGKADMAYELHAITFDEYNNLRNMLIRDGINNYRNIKIE